MAKKGILLISLDFELYWGMRDKASREVYGQNVLGARTVIPKMLELFQNYKIHATWSAVGFLFFDNRKELISSLPALKPEYEKPEYSPYRYLDTIGPDETGDPYHYARSLILKIKSSPGQEIASHTFSHYYCLEQGQTKEHFYADLKAAKEAADKLGIVITSLVFPRNQVNPAYFDICRELGIKAIRGNERSWLYGARAEGKESKVRRLARLADAYVNISGHNTYPVPSAQEPLVNLPASRFYRAYFPELKFFELMKLSRIKKDLEFAADNGHIYHLWWHPHNFGVNTERNLKNLEEILIFYKNLNAENRIESLNMAEISALAVNGNKLEK